MKPITLLSTIIPAAFLLNVTAGEGDSPAVGTDFALLQEAYIKAAFPGENDTFGTSIAFSGNTAVVGAPDEDSKSSGINGDPHNDDEANAGAVFVFVRTLSTNGQGETTATWTQQAYLKASNPDGSDMFGHSVAIDGDTIIVGAPFEDSGALTVDGIQNNSSMRANSGAAYVFERDDFGNWSQQAYIKPSASEQNARFGYSVDLCGDAAIVGANLKDTDAGDSGSAFIFRRTGNSWAEEAQIVPDAVGEFGRSVAISGSTAIVGAPTEEIGSASRSGAVYLFTGKLGSWTRQQKIDNPQPDEGDVFGWDVDIDSDTAVVGAYSDLESPGSVHSPGSTFIFDRSSTTWTLTERLIGSTAGNAEAFGRSVAIDGNLIVVGASGENSSTSGINPEENPHAVGSGAAYVFARDEDSGGWEETHFVKASNTDANDSFGWDVAVSRSVVLAGAPGEDNSAGSVNPSEAPTLSAQSGAFYSFAIQDGTLRIVDVTRVGDNFYIDFELGGGSPAIPGIAVKGSPDLQDFSLDLTNEITFSILLGNVYRATIDIDDLPSAGYFFRLER